MPYLVRHATTTQMEIGHPFPQWCEHMDMESKSRKQALADLFALTEGAHHEAIAEGDDPKAPHVAAGEVVQVFTIGGEPAVYRTSAQIIAVGNDG